MDLESTLLVLASLVAGVLIAQTILLLVFIIAFRQWCNRTNTAVDQISRSVEPVLQVASELLTDSRERISSLTGNLNEISILAKNQMTRLDSFLQGTTERAQLQILRLDDLISDTMNRVEQTTEAIQQGVLTPIRELTALVAGVRASLDFLLRRNRKTVERATQDEELFI